MSRLNTLQNILFASAITIVLNIVPSGNGQQEPLSSNIKRLGVLNVYPEYITLSGYSSGGTFAQQLQISYSSLFTGIAVFSHTYYRCGPGDGIQENYDNVCTRLGNFPNERLYDPNLAIADINNYYRLGLIENPANLKDKLLYVYAGTRNQFFSTDQSLRILNIYEPLIQNICNIKTRVQNANLTLPSDRFGGPCETESFSNFGISNCGLSGAFDALSFLIGPNVQRLADPNERVPLQPLLTFDQTEFFYGIDGTGRHDMDSIGYVYVPSKCIFLQCYLHLYFHGCSTGREFVGENHIRNSGYLEVAELNNIIVIFPQSRSSLPQNEIGCWDTYGLTGTYYATQRGAQVTVVRNIIARVLGEDGGGHGREPNVQGHDNTSVQQSVAINPIVNNNLFG